jgi:hypothetical protein
MTKLRYRLVAAFAFIALVGSGLTLATATSVAADTTPRSTEAALVALKSLKVQTEKGAGYNRSLFRHWIDANGNGCDTRQEVLIRQSLRAVTRGPGCRVTSGQWLSVFDNVRTTNPSTFDIDHFVPLAEAWRSGARTWNADTRTAFANDLGYRGSLVAVTASSNRSKGDKDPARWLPPNQHYVCDYVSTWIAVKHRWSLSIDKNERNALRRNVKTCGNPHITLPPKAKVVTGGTGSGSGSGGSNSGSGSNPGNGNPGNTVGYTVRPGAFCSERGAYGRTNAGTLMQCKTSSTDSRYRWRAA